MWCSCLYAQYLQDSFRSLRIFRPLIQANTRLREKAQLYALNIEFGCYELNRAGGILRTFKGKECKRTDRNNIRQMTEDQYSFEGAALWGDISGIIARSDLKTVLGLAERNARPGRTYR